MNILHICLNGPYTDNWSYQDNIIPKYHKTAGNNVTVIATIFYHSENGHISETTSKDYLTNEGVRIIRLKSKKTPFKLYNQIFQPYDIFDLLKELNPNIIMVHGLIGSVSALQVKKYVKKINKNCKVVADIHQDYYNSPVKKNIKRKLLTFVHRYLNRKMFSLYKKIYYMAPSCKEYALGYYKAPAEKLDFLPLGCEENIVDFNNRQVIRNEIRQKFGIGENDIVICHGGKLDKNKKTVELIKTVKTLRERFPHIKLVIFGYILNGYDSVENLIEENKDFIIYLGMLSTEEYYKVFLASDIAVFPGGQSVLWQQSISCGLAIMVKCHTGIEYLDFGGNAVFLDNANPEEIYSKLNYMIKDDKYKKMKLIAEEKGMPFFSYNRISNKILKDLEK